MEDSVRKEEKQMMGDTTTTTIDGFSPISATTRVFWNSRKRPASGRNLEKITADHMVGDETLNKQEESPTEVKVQQHATVSVLSDRRKSLFQPLEPNNTISSSRRPSAEMLLPPPDFDSASYPKGWLIGKKRKLVNVDVVESMRRIAVQEMNRKVLPNMSPPLSVAFDDACVRKYENTLLSLQDREIGGLNEQLEEDARCLEHLQLQLLQERSKRADVERENTVLQNQISMLMNMMQDEEEGSEEP